MNDQNELKQLAERIVKERIKGTRKGLPDIPTYTHSFHVAEELQKDGLNFETCLAGLLHDIIEDGGTTLGDLRAFGFSDRVVALVDLCSHDNNIESNNERWAKMISRLVEANDSDAWLIKLADITDNFGDAYAMSKNRADYMLCVKIPVLLKNTELILSASGTWNRLNEMYKEAIETKRTISKEIDFILREVNETLKLQQDIIEVVSVACKNVLDVNYGYNNQRLAKSIIDLHDIMERSSEQSSSRDFVSLKILSNGICGDLLLKLHPVK